MNAQLQAWLNAFLLWLAAALSTQTGTGSQLPPPPPPYPTAMPTATAAPSPTIAPTAPPSVVPSATPTPMPTPLLPYYFNPTPGATWPIPVALPQNAHITVVATLQCSPTAGGGTAMSFVGSWSLATGQCDGSVNAKDASGLHFYDVAHNVQAWLPVALVAGKTYVVAGTQDGTNLGIVVCLAGVGAAPCLNATIADSGSLSPGTAAYIGGASATTRPFAGQIKNVGIYPPLTVGQIQSMAASVVTFPSPSPIQSAPPNPTPTPYPSSSPIGSKNPYPPLSASFYGKTPFHATVDQLAAAGILATESSDVANNFWSEGAEGNERPYGGTPIYVAGPNDQLYYWNDLRMYGSNTSLDRKRSHFPKRWIVQSSSTGNADAHIDGFDQYSPDGPGDYGAFSCSTPSGNNISCGWGAQYLFSGSGLTLDNAKGGNYNAGGYSNGLMTLSAYDMWNAAHGIPIAHALGFGTTCEEARPGYYPSNAWSTDGPGGSTDCAHIGKSPNTRYGNLIQLKSSFDIAKSGASEFCQYVLQALKTFGGYTFDNNGCCGITLSSENPDSYDVQGSYNYWTATVYPSMYQGRDASSDSNPSRDNIGGFGYWSCLNRVPSGNGANYWNVYHLTISHSSQLP